MEDWTDVDKSREIISNIVAVLLIRCVVKYIHTDDEMCVDLDIFDYNAICGAIISANRFSRNVSLHPYR